MSEAKKTMTSFAEQGIPACLWKSFDRWQDGASGKTDIDLLIEERSLSDAQGLLKREGWIFLKAESWRSFPHVYDFLRFDEGMGCFIHLHVHARITTGAKLTKPLTPPWNDFYLDNIESDPVPHVKADVEFIMFVLRLCTKQTWVDYARILRRRSYNALFRDMKQEYVALRERCSRETVQEMLETGPYHGIPADIIFDAYDDLYSLTWVRRILLRRYLKRFRRMSGLRILLMTVCRTILKKYQGVGKTIPDKGLSLAICGADGSGKTTLCDAVEKQLARHFKIHRYYMGGTRMRPGFMRGLLMKPLWPLYLALRRTCTMMGQAVAAERLRKLYFDFDEYLTQKEKFRRFLRAQKNVRKGGIVLFERYPLFKGYGDGLSTALPMPDLLFIIDIPENEAIRRRPGDAPATIAAKVAAFKAQPNATFLKGTSPVEMNCVTVLAKIQRHLELL